MASKFYEDEASEVSADGSDFTDDEGTEARNLRTQQGLMQKHFAFKSNAMSELDACLQEANEDEEEDVSSFSDFVVEDDATVEEDDEPVKKTRFDLDYERETEEFAKHQEKQKERRRKWQDQEDSDDEPIRRSPILRHTVAEIEKIVPTFVTIQTIQRKFIRKKLLNAQRMDLISYIIAQKWPNDTAVARTIGDLTMKEHEYDCHLRLGENQMIFRFSSDFCTLHNMELDEVTQIRDLFAYFNAKKLAVKSAWLVCAVENGGHGYLSLINWFQKQMKGVGIICVKIGKKRDANDCAVPEGLHIQEAIN